MKNLNTWLTAIAFSLAGVAVHVNAAEKSCLDGTVCFQSAPVAGKNGSAQLAEDGYSKTPLGKRLDRAQPALAADGFGKTPLGKRLVEHQPQLAEDGYSRTPLGMRQEQSLPTLAADGFGKTPLGKHLVGQQEAGVV